MIFKIKKYPLVSERECVEFVKNLGVSFVLTNSHSIKENELWEAFEIVDFARESLESIFNFSQDELKQKAILECNKLAFTIKTTNQSIFNFKFILRSFIATLKLIWKSSYRRTKLTDAFRVAAFAVFFVSFVTFLMLLL